LDELRIRWAGSVAVMGKKKNEYGVLVGKPEGKRPLRHRWKDIIKIDVTTNGMEGHGQDISGLG
jgi:hypothetical protein